MVKAYVLSEEDRDAIRMLIQAEVGRVVNTRNRPHFHEEQYLTPEIYVALTPTGGIDAMEAVGTGTGTFAGETDVPGYADCDIYKVKVADDSADPLNIHLEPLEGVSRLVFNISETAIAGDTFIVVARDKLGRWLAMTGAGGGAGAESKLVLLVDKIPTSPPTFGIYTWVGVLDAETPTALTYTATGEMGSPTNEPAYHEQNIDLPVTDHIVTGPKGPDDLANVDYQSGSDWQGYQLAGTSDDAWACATMHTGGHTDWLQATNFGFALPTDQIPVSLTVEVECHASEAVVQVAALQLVVGGVIVGTSVSAGEVVQPADTYLTFSAPFIDWGVVPTVSQINSSGFGVAIRFSVGDVTGTGSGTSGAEVCVDNIRITVHSVLFDEGCVVRVWRGTAGAGNYWLITVPPRWEYVRFSAGDDSTSIDGVVYQTGSLVYYDQSLKQFVSYETVFAINVTDAT